MPGMRSLEERFFRSTARIGVTVTLTTALVCAATGYVGIRAIAIDHFQLETRQALDAYELSGASDVSVKHYLQAFARGAGFTLLCAYDEQDKPSLQWQADNAHEHCPPMMVEQGTHAGTFTIRIAEPIRVNGQYRGMLYATGELLLATWLSGSAALLATLLLICWLACRRIAALNANYVTAQLDSIRRQVECLKDNDISVCAIPQKATAAEIAALSAAIESLRTHLDHASVPKSMVTDIRRWHWETLSALLAGLRQRIDAASPLLESLNDYALLIQTERNDALSEPRPFDLAQLIDECLTAVRKSNPPMAHVNLTASLQSDMPRRWIGQPEIMGALLRHLLLVGLKRTRSGFVYLRLEAAITPAGGTHLHIAFEDSSPKVQQWQLTQWLALAHEDTPYGGPPDDISWLLVARLFKRLGGAITGAGGESGGLALEGHLPLTEANDRAEPHIAAPAYTHARPPLVLLVENDSSDRQKLVRIFEMAGCRTFALPTHAEALEWAVSLPFSVIVLNTMLSDGLEDIARKLRHMKEDGRLRPIPCWALIAKHSFIEFDYWRRLGASELLLKPLRGEHINQLCRTLESPEESFYGLQNTALYSDFSGPIVDELPRLRQMLAVQVAELKPLLRMLAEGETPTGLAFKAHSVKSVALTLGYFRLALLMGQVERQSSRNLTPGNWRIIADCLEEQGAAEPPYPALPSDPTHHHSAP